MGQEYGGPIPHRFLKFDTLHSRSTDKYIIGMALRKIASDIAISEIKNINNASSSIKSLTVRTGS